MNPYKPLASFRSSGSGYLNKLVGFGVLLYIEGVITFPNARLKTCPVDSSEFANGAQTPVALLTEANWPGYPPPSVA